MSKPFSQIAAFGILLGLALPTGLALAAHEDSKSEPRIDTFVNPEGTGYFALRLTPNAVLPQPLGREVVILFDTSASQTSVFRDKGMTALTTLLGSLHRGDRVQLMAVDLDAVPLTSGFVAPTSQEMGQAVAELKRRVPLGATDMPLVLQAGAGCFGAKAGSKTLIYIGDGMSTANFMALEEYRKLVNSLVDRHVPLSSYAVGPRLDTQLLAALANVTGGMLAIDSDSIDPKQAGAFMASAVEGTVLWPTAVTWPKQFAEIYPERVPPLRSDRDTVVVGKGKVVGEIEVAMTVEVGGKSQRLNWTLSAGESNPDFAFLTTLVDAAHSDGGLRLITLGTPGMDEARRILDEGVQALAQLGTQAVTSGNLETAERLADEALRRDPNDPTARAVKKQLAKIRVGEPLDKAGEEKLQIKKSSIEQAAPPKKVLAVKARKPAAEPIETSNNVNDGEGRLLSDIDQQNRLITDLIRTEVDHELREARTRMASDPASVEQGLKLLMERVVQAPELKAEIRAQLRGQLETALRDANKLAATKEIIDQQVQEAKAGAQDRLRIADALIRKEEKVKQLMDRFNSLMDEGRYTAADAIGSTEVAEIAADLPIAQSAALVAHEAGARVANVQQRNARQKAVVDTLATVEVAMIPFPDDQPVVYPDAVAWEELTNRRRKYKEAVDLKKVGPAEAKIRAELKNSTTMDFTETPLLDVVDYLKELHNIEIQLDTKALSDAGIAPDTAVTRNLKGISLKAALKLLLGEMDLTYIIEDEVLKITTVDVAGTKLVTKVYPVADLVIPVPVTSGGGMMGGMGGGMMGGMGGGMGGGGMGGMGGGGMGGMGGGGMGGMGGGGMGGMGGGGGGMFNVADVPQSEPQTFQAFAVPDDLKLTPEKATPSDANAKPAQPAVKSAAKQPVAAGKNVRAKTALPAAGQLTQPAAPRGSGAPAAASQSERKASAIDLHLPPDADSEVAWHEYFSTHLDVKPDAVRETVRQLMHERQFTPVIGLIRAALRDGLPQPWMYEAMALAMQASGSSKDQIERALMSAVDFGDSTEDLMYVAQYMARSGLEIRALKIFRQVAMVEPLRPEPYLFGLQLAQRLNDLEGIRWSSLGILKQAWPKDRSDAVQNASRAAAAMLEQLKAEKRLPEAAAFQAQLDEARIRDCLVKVTWTGDADVDIMVEEPAGTTCTFRNPRTTAGGVMLGDVASREGRNSPDSLSESYVCPEAFNGTYRVLVRRVWGKVTAGKVTVDIYSHYGTKDQKHLKKQIPLSDKDELIVFDLQDGRRKEPLAEQQLANAAAGQIAVNQAILAQQIASLPGSQAAGFNLGASRQTAFAVPFIQQAVGYMPIIQNLSTGARMTTSGVVSADRRYVRVTPFPFFSQIGSVTTFNLQQGVTGTTQGTSGSAAGTGFGGTGAAGGQQNSGR